MSSCPHTRAYDLLVGTVQSSSKFAHVMVQRPSGTEIAAFRMRALPFGAVRSIHSFLTANYFDDFVTLGTMGESSALATCTLMVFKLFGSRGCKVSALVIC